MESYGAHPHVRFRLPDGEIRALEPGDIVGRVWSAALPIDDPRISEAHALVSLRDGALWLLSLRRLIAVGGKPVAEVRLQIGVVIDLADGLPLVVDGIELPAELLVIEAKGLPSTVLPSVCALVTQPRLSLVPRHDPRATCIIWSTGAGWRIKLGHVTTDLNVDTPYCCDGVTFYVRTRVASGAERTRDPGGVHAPLRLIAAFDTVQFHRTGEPVVIVGGLAARILSELVAMGGPVHWATLAGEIWPHETDASVLRKRWDVALVRTRARLRDSRLRPDLIHADGTGQLELMLRDGDSVEDRT